MKYIILFLPQGRYHESLVLIPLLEVCQEWGSFIGVLGGCFGFLSGDLKYMVISNVMDEVILDVRGDNILPKKDTLNFHLNICIRTASRRGSFARVLGRCGGFPFTSWMTFVVPIIFIFVQVMRM